MLTSINPLGERARNNRWGFTVVWYLLGTAIAGGAMGVALGFAGSILPSGSWALGAVAVAALVGLVFDLGIGGTRLPSIHRQVNEAWLGSYRSWVYGLGFGFQLGTGVITIVTTAVIYVVWVVAFLSGSLLVGGLVGLAFGTIRGSVILTVRNVDRPDRLHALMRRGQRWAVLSGRFSIAALVFAAISTAAMAI